MAQMVTSLWRRGGVGVCTSAPTLEFITDDSQIPTALGPIMNGVQDSVRVLVLYKHEPVWLLLIQYRAKGWSSKVLCGSTDSWKFLYPINMRVTVR